MGFLSALLAILTCIVCVMLAGIGLWSIITYLDDIYEIDLIGGIANAFNRILDIFRR